MNHVPNFQSVLSRSVDIFPEIERFHEEINMSVVTSTGELRVYFKQILKTWAGKLSRDSAGRAHFTGLRRSSKLKRAQLKLFSLGGTFRLSWASQPIASVSVNDSWKGRIRHKSIMIKIILGISDPWLMCLLPHLVKSWSLASFQILLNL